MKTTYERFIEKIVETDGCWIWTSSVVRGYGTFAVQTRKDVKAHRLAYEMWVGPIPEGLQIDHLCDNKLCVNPDHLKPATARENTLRSNNPAAQNARKTHCKRGHEFTPENTYMDKHMRNCRKCGVLKTRRYKARKVTVVG